MEDKFTDLDKRIREALENLEAPFQADHWEQFSEQLDQAEANEPDAIIDGLIVGRMEELDMPLDQGAWSVFESKLEAAEAEMESEIDQMAQEKLGPMEVPFNPVHWDQMAQRLDVTYAFRQKLYRYKVLEISLILLLLLTLWNYLPQEQKALSPVPAFPELRPLQTPVSENTESPVAQALSEKEKDAEAAPEGTLSAESSAAATHNEKMTMADIESPVRTSPVVKTEDDRSLKPQASASLPPSLSALDRIYLLNEVSSLNAFKPLVSISGQTTPDLDFLATSLEPSASFPDLALLQAIRYSAKKDWLRVGMLVGGDYNVAFTPYDEVFDLGPYAVDSTGYSAGISIGASVGRFEVETGGIYSYKTYRPFAPKQQIGNLDYLIEQSFEGIHFDMLEIPLQFRYFLKERSSKWNFYGQAGASMNLILKSIYEINQTDFYKNAGPPPSRDLREKVNDLSQFSQKDFTEGLFEGGAFRDNLYFSVIVGMGVERTVSDRWRVFAQPTYFFPLQLKGLGPNQDRLHSLSFRFGARVDIW